MDKRMVMGAAFGVVAVGAFWFFAETQRSDSSAVGTRVAPPAAPVTSAAVAIGTTRLQIDEKGTATFLIDAPLEKIKGRWTKFRGTLDLDPMDLTKSHGEVDLDLDDLKTETFGDPEKDSAQTEHAHNWLEIGADAPEREANRWARFTFKSLESAVPAKLSEAPEQDGARTLKIVAHGDMWLHGVTSPKTVKLTVTARGPANAPTSLTVKTDEPIVLSLKEHDVKPRDVAGKFLNGALEKVGKKIDDSVQISLDVTASPLGAKEGATAAGTLSEDAAPHTP